MESLLAIACLLSGVALTVVVLGLIVRRAMEQLAVANAYREVAQALGLAVDTRGMSIRGRIGGRKVWIGEFTESDDGNRRTVHLGKLRFSRPLCGGISIRNAKKSDRNGKQTAVPLGDPATERLWVVHATDPHLGGSLLTPMLRSTITDIASTFPSFSVTDDGISVTLDRPARSERDLHNLVQRLTRAADAIDQARANAKRPGDLDRWALPWEHLAASLQWNFDGQRLSLDGAYEQRSVRIFPRRTPVGFESVTQLILPLTPRADLAIQDRARLLNPSRLDLSIRTGDPAFDEAFSVRGSDPQTLRDYLDAPTRNALLAARALGRIAVDDYAITLSTASLEPDTLREGLKRLNAAATALLRPRPLIPPAAQVAETVSLSR